MAADMHLVRMMFLGWACLAGSTPSLGGLIVVDSFQDNLNIAPLPGSTGGFQDSAAVFGGRRVYNVANTNTLSGLTIGSGSSQFLATESSSPGIASYSLTYQDLTPSVDLGAAGAYDIQLLDVQSNTNWTTNISFKGVNSATPATYSTVIPSGSNGTITIPFAAFINGPISTLGNIESISFSFSSNTGASRSLSMGGISITAVPEPSVILLSGLALVAQPLRRFYRKRRAQRN